MTNEEKAREIAECNDGHINIISFESAKIMAEWKDKLFKKYLEKKKGEYGIDYDVNAIDMLNEIISDLFPKSEEQDSSDNDE